MHKHTVKNSVATAIVLAIALGVMASKSANAVIFNLVATCDATCSSPLIPGSPVSGELILNDSVLVGGVLPANGPIVTADIISLMLTFETDTAPNFLVYDFGTSFEPFPAEPVGSFNAAGTGIESIKFTDSTGTQFFQVASFAEGQPVNWILSDDITGFGEVVTFEIPTVTVPAPESGILFMLAAALLGVQTRRRIKIAIRQ